MKTQKRIEKICEAVKIAIGKSTSPLLVADIATDHGYIAETISKFPEVEQVVATDISDKSLSKLQKMIAIKGLKKIETRQGDGLYAIERADICVIAGIGGFEIKKMIERENLLGGEVKCNIFVLQPAQNETQLREWIFDSGYYVLLDEVIEDNERFFPIIVIDISRKQENEKNIYNIWLGRDSMRNIQDFKLFLRDLEQKLQFLDGIPRERIERDEILMQKYLLKQKARILLKHLEDNYVRRNG